MPVETKAELATRNKELQETLDWVAYDHERLSEALSNAVSLLHQEDVGWATPGYEGQAYNGLSLHDLHKWSTDIRVSLTGTPTRAPNPHMRNGLMLRHSFIWQGGIHYDKIPAGGRQGVNNIKGKIDDPQNQRLIFSDSARQRREHALYADGLYAVIGQDSNKKMRVIPLKEITDTQRDKFFQDEIVAYRWTRYEIDGRATPINGMAGRVEKSYWVYTDWYKAENPGGIPDYIAYNGKQEKVLKNFTLFDQHANRPEGAAFGSPDAIAAVVWARIIRDLIMNGVKMQDALAMFAFKAVSPTKKGQDKAAFELGKRNEAGSNATLGPDQDLVPLNSAGRGYDFSTIGFVVATMAASLHVSGIALSANTALAGSSYGAAKTLDLPGRMAMETRRAEHKEFDRRILNWMGATDAEIYFDNYDDATDEYRAVQAAMLAWTTGTLSPEGFRAELEIIYGRALSGSIPPGAINPNTETQADREAAAAALVPLTTPSDKGAFTAKAPARRAAKGGTKQAAASNQGKASGAGGAGHANDIPAK